MDIYNSSILTTVLALVLALGGCGGGGSGGGETSVPTGAAPPPTTSGGDDNTSGNPKPTFSAEFEDLFSLGKMHLLTVSVTEDEWNGLLNDFDGNPRNEIFRKADFTYGEGADAEQVANVGFRLRGNVFTRQRPEAGSGPHDASNDLRRVHFRIKFNEQFQDSEGVYGLPSKEIATVVENKNRDFRSVRSLNLKYNNNDSTYTREVFSYDLFNRFGVETLRQAYTGLYIKIGNEPKRYMGVYMMGEHVDKTWAQRRFGKNAFVFKSLYQGHGPADLADIDMDHNIETGKIGAEQTDPAYFGIGFDAYRPAYDLKTKKQDFLEAESRLNELIGLLNGNPTQQMLEDAIDIESLLRAQAVNVFLGNWDDYWRNGNNYYLVLDPNNSRWVFVPYDYDIVLFDNIFMFSNIADASFLYWGNDRLSGNPVLMDKVLAFDDFRQEYAGYVAELLADDSVYASAAAISERLNTLQSVVLPHVGGYEAIDSVPFLGDLSEIEAYVDDRIAAARREIDF
ncbi:MAG: CotH kinase family protein [Gammaproteobacteria bacterium]|nr:CotH kinase family protein [Gammaproteobacteria bacterium]